MLEYAIIFSAGLGTRLKPLTETTPKPLVKVGGKALLDYQIEACLHAGVKKIIVNIFYFPEQFEAHIKQVWKDYLDRIIIIKEVDRLETGGGLKNALKIISSPPQHIICLNADSIFPDYKKLNQINFIYNEWQKNKPDNLLLLKNKNEYIGYDGIGDFEFEGENILVKKSKNNFAFTGLQIIKTEQIKNYDKEIFSLSEIFKINLADKNLLGVLFDGIALHVGDMDGYKKAEYQLGIVNSA